MSSTAGQGQAFGWIEELLRRPGNERCGFVNPGVGGDFALVRHFEVAATASTPT